MDDGEHSLRVVDEQVGINITGHMKNVICDTGIYYCPVYPRFSRGQDHVSGRGQRSYPSDSIKVCTNYILSRPNRKLHSLKPI